MSGSTALSSRWGPVDTEKVDRGCPAVAECTSSLNCPFPVCVYDVICGTAALNSLRTAVLFVRLVTAGRDFDEARDLLGISPRQASRASATLRKLGMDANTIALWPQATPTYARSI